jgi:hypothetical protein
VSAHDGAGVDDGANRDGAAARDCAREAVGYTRPGPQRPQNFTPQHERDIDTHGQYH